MVSCRNSVRNVCDGAPSRSRQALIFAYPKSLYRDQAINDETEHLDARRLSEFAAKLYPSADTARRRDLEAHIAERTGSIDKALAILRGGTTDDASERAARVLDAHALNSRQAELVGETMFNHRHFDRAIVLLSSIQSPKPATIFEIGRSYYGAEKYAEAEQAYLRALETLAGQASIDGDVAAALKRTTRGFV